ncbi:hypothetical protein AJ80_03017 [Polytolypa hystricis UAMH7299]|uniref:C2H2-type domain-containing protein n=1 Tax=Polytolypa hystricis (strain UAMH7299) TaxID=1447883 RepID=A0A2B7YQ12_POLH7|nr:hypothetical protein AJ80_03017 [Polytolypa hystricis UAMH7299]
MDNSHVTSPPSIRVYDFNSNHHRRRSSSKSSTSSVSAQSFSSRAPMAIPNANEPLAPPPLPPPRYIEDLANGHDSGWKWGNSFHEAEFGKTTLAPIKPSSSLLGGSHTRPELARRHETFRLDTEATLQDSMSTNNSSNRPSPDAADRMGFSLSPSTGPSLSSPLASGLPSPLLQGEKPLSQKSVERSCNEYDKRVLSKIGKPGSPPRSVSSLGSSLGGRDFGTLPFHFKSRNTLPGLTISDGALSPRDAGPRWSNTTTPQSAGISPGTRSGWSDYVSYRSPSVDSIAPPPSEYDHYNQARDRRTGVGAHEESSLASRSNRGSYDQAVFPDSDIDFPMDETNHARHRNVEDRTLPPFGSMSPLSRQGMKRRASSPPREAAPDELHILRTSTSNGDLNQRRTSGFPFNDCVSPGARYNPHHGSVSSASSMSFRTNSYASSTGHSIGASSMSSFDRPSPGGISPTSELDHSYDKGVISPGSHKSNTASRARMHRDSVDAKGAGTTRDITTHSVLAVSKSAASRMGRSYICKCCPKKAKKFDTIEELRAHEMEKQYTCHFCSKRFKNKNEAERHQNSLHLRRHSWSCAALSGYEAVFHPSSSPTCQTPTGPSHDTCGYCGVEFTNYPRPEWDQRIDHLTTVHKFGECNQAKKFYRADHFRQHLKHSHAGASGKWTNILENACMKEEPPADIGLASIGEHGGRDSEDGVSGDGMSADNVIGAMTASLTSHTIDEVMEES